jgi:hypothetical protein
MPKTPSSVSQRGGSGHFNQGQPDQDFYMDDEENVRSTTQLDRYGIQHLASSPDGSVRTAVELTGGCADWVEVRSLAYYFGNDDFNS